MSGVPASAPAAGLAALPMPPDAPPPGACIRSERPEPGLAVLTFDPPHRSLAVFDAPLLRDLDRALAEAEGDTSLRGLVLTGRAPDQFLAGADVEAILALEDPAAVHAIVRAVHGIFARLARSRLFTVAAIGGPAPGGACELALCCDRIVLSDHPRTAIGLPEVKLGIFPAWGGVHRLPRRIGVPRALDVILQGRVLPAKDAARIGLADRVTRPEYLLKVAADVALGRERCARRGRGAYAWLVDRNPIALALIGKRAREAVRASTRGHYPAPERALDLVLGALRVPESEFAAREAEALVPLATGPVCKNLVRLFLAGEAAKKRARTAPGAGKIEVRQAAVLGAGVMGAGIASAFATAGIWTRLYDVAGDAVDEAVLAHRADVARALQRRRLQKHEADAAIDRLDGIRTPEGFRRCDLVLEAVAEKLPVKHAVLGEVASQVRSDTLLASNTSSLSIDAIAEPLPGPERVVGMHFFNPPKRMPLVEVVRGTRTADEVVTAACALAVRLGKTPVVVRDVPGFLVNRCLGPYLDEAVRLFVDGADPLQVDRALREFGMPMGPFALLDEVGFDIAAHAAASLHAAYGPRMTPSEGLAGMIAAGRMGKKSGHGFYRHDRTGRARPQISELNHFHQKGTAARALSAVEIVDRLVLAMVNEAARCLEEGVVASAQELDLAMVFGTGFAPFRGGPLRYADSVGIAEVVRRLEGIRQAPDVQARGEAAARFAPADLLRERGLAGTPIHPPGSP
ncbi:MAG TPA: 3-hydroxyacyl-CoA dehydrogenase NAD-binding domain-containing protein [Planctomycetota bacterium]|nr:3-hydroxyacyl-CoA dehydrogenase NAD-binding domain-containing protein [Planctomycetota bacterium]